MISEFYCDQCKGYNSVKLAEQVNGLHIIICGKCNHDHYRCIVNGNITDVRYDKDVLERIRLNAFTYKGKWRVESWEKHPFLSELWARMTV